MQFGLPNDQYMSCGEGIKAGKLLDLGERLTGMKTQERSQAKGAREAPQPRDQTALRRPRRRALVNACVESDGEEPARESRDDGVRP
jgi:hypothetical protein